MKNQKEKEYLEENFRAKFNPMDCILIGILT